MIMDQDVLLFSQHHYETVSFNYLLVSFLPYGGKHHYFLL